MSKFETSQRCLGDFTSSGAIKIQNGFPCGNWNDKGVGSISHEDMKTIAAERYDAFDARRRTLQAQAADAEDLKAIENLEKDLKRKGGKA